MTQPCVVFGVHAVRPNEISATALLCSTLPKAEAYAKALSTDPGVLAGAVTRYEVDTQGVRTAVSLWVAGVRQEAPYVSDDRKIAANGLFQKIS